MNQLIKTLNGLSFLSQGTAPHQWFATSPFSRQEFWNLVGIVHESIDDEGCLIRSYRGYYEVTFKCFEANVTVVSSSNGVYVQLSFHS